MGNTAAVNRLVYGWYPRDDFLNSNCIVLFGHDPRRHSWTMEYKSIRMRQAKVQNLLFWIHELNRRGGRYMVTAGQELTH